MLHDEWKVRARFPGEPRRVPVNLSTFSKIEMHFPGLKAKGVCYPYCLWF